MLDGITNPASLPLHHGGRVDACRIAWRVHGELSPEAAPILVLGGISADRRVRSGSDEAVDGWWEWALAPGHALDPAARPILSLDWLGGAGDSAGSWRDGVDEDGVPLLGVPDLADTIVLVLDHLGVARLHAIVGSSFGGCVALSFAERHPARVGRLVVIGAAERPCPLASAVRVLQRRIVTDAVRTGAPDAGVRLARSLAVTTYRSEAEFHRRFAAPPSVHGGRVRFPFEAYLDHQGERFAERFPPAAFVALSRALDLHRVDPECVRCPTTLVALEGDRVAPPRQIRALARRLPLADLIELDTEVGHDAFLAEPERILPALDRAFGCGEVAA
jgi:homoserine O-acetyltransferase